MLTVMWDVNATFDVNAMKKVGMKQNDKMKEMFTIEVI